MRILNFLMAVTLMVALLPWGSFVSRFDTAGPRAGLQHAQSNSPAQMMAAHKLCKGPVLPGSPCSPVQAVLSALVTLDFAAPAALAYAALWPAPLGHQPPLLLEPPRSA